MSGDEFLGELPFYHNDTSLSFSGARWVLFFGVFFVFFGSDRN